ncbi:MAG: CAP domain-containing protein [Pseudomonadota bacterium]
MKIWSRILCISVLAGVISACTTSSTPVASDTTEPTAAPTAALSSVERSAIDLINAQRSQNGRSTLAISPNLVRAAQLHAADMTQNAYFSHTGLNGSNVKTRVNAQGFKGCYWAENIASGRETAEGVVQAWIDSDAHRKNILTGSANQIGVGTSNGVWVAVFARAC